MRLRVGAEQREGRVGMWTDLLEGRTLEESLKLQGTFGAGEAAVLSFLRMRFTWWPLHPLGLAFQYTTGPRYYALSILMVWAAKLVIVRFGGPSMYEKAKPFFYGTVIGYCVGIAIIQVIDLIWFPGSGHGFHNY